VSKVWGAAPIALMSIIIPLALSAPLHATQRMVLAEEFTNYT
jgi:hypothetical protein